MHYLVSAICILAACAVTQAWYNRFDNAVYGGWAPDRRSMARECSETGGRCIKKYQCCSDNDVCMIEDTFKFGFGMCKPKYKILDAYNFGAKFGFKKAGEECTDSLDCADQCCHPIIMGRMGLRLRCGKADQNTACVGRLFSKNDIFDGY
ncbi:hypothetical protein ACF0H5_012366 [Mactra antiquata]